MSDRIDTAYFLRRAQEERRKAEHVEDPAVAEHHLQMAECLEEKAVQLGGLVETD